MSVYSSTVFFLQKKTVDRLLKKQDSKVSKTNRLRSSKKAIPMLSYVNNRDMVGLSVPASLKFPMEAQREKYGYSWILTFLILLLTVETETSSNIHLSLKPMYCMLGEE